MALATEDKQEIGEIVQGVIQKTAPGIVAKEVETKIEPLDTRIRVMEIKQERFEHDIRGMLGDILSILKDSVGLRGRVDQHDADIGVLNSAVFGRRRKL